jgi:decaprenylphospho-beta-D-erythro-pentofuranosid-2-ulose 2-reductase
MQNIVILGATSAIAEQTARIYAGRGDTLCLVARDQGKLEHIKSDLEIRGASQVTKLGYDLNHTHLHQELLEEVKKALEHIDVVLVAYGTLGDQKKCQQDFDETLQELQTNCLSVISLLTLFANYLEKQKAGCIATISSPAGDRGRQSNYIYGSAKGALTVYLQGLRNRLYSSNVQVLTIKPGFVDTPMTTDFKKGLLWVKPDVVARGIVRAIDRKKDVVYLPFFWRYIMLVIKLIPESIFKRLSL